MSFWFVLLVLGCGEPAAPVEEGPAVARMPEGPPVHVGVERCASCHEAQVAALKTSDHWRAMQRPTEEAVEGAFDGSGAAGMRFLQEGERFVVETEGPDGKPGTFDVTWTFGHYPLQQYLVALSGGQVGTLTTAWDSRPVEQGGQRWYSLYPDEDLHAGDPLHWTGRGQRWNLMCADCHSTAFRKGLDPQTGVYASTFEEITVSCEACHGPGSHHVATEGRAALVLGARPRTWEMEADGIASRSPASADHPEVETCGACHARRSKVVDAQVPGAPLLDGHRPAVLEEGLYFADGQIHDEVYVWGSFVQSKMYAAGVECSDCHDPHSGRVRTEGDGLCLSCHAPAAYAATEHHHHEEGTAGCVDCHMPTRTYMGVDARRDHSLRVPRPDLALGAPDPCTGCHEQRDATWAAATIEGWTGRAVAPHYGSALAAGRSGALDAPLRLAELVVSKQPAIARATALDLLGNYPMRESWDLGVHALGDPDALVRVHAVRLLAALASPEQCMPHLRPLLSDPVRLVRIEVARALQGSLPVEGAYARALQEAEGELLLNGDQAAAWVQLGVLRSGVRDAQGARQAFRRALELDRGSVAAWVDLADLARAAGDEAEAQRILAKALDAVPGAPEVYGALAMSQTRQGRVEEALVSLGTARELADDPRYDWLFALALHGAGRTPEALAALEAAVRAHPRDRAVLQALVTMNAEAGDLASARAWAALYAERVPWDPAARQFVTHLAEPPR